ncbi:hypothetical protein [Actinoplanes sp. NPDC026619]|uniref:hypothetical protein n=1 Tax=Actinoplanes sp. NPDC026619 TaxID=3155798 RepID=UPI0033F192EB
MTPQILVSLAALMASILAVSLSSGLALRQQRLAKQANQLPVVDYLWIMRSPDFLRCEERLWDELPKQDQTLRFAELPQPLRDETEAICVFYQKVAYLVGLEVVDERLAIVPLAYRGPRSWAAIEPFVANERRARNDELSFYNAFEDLICRIRRADVPRMSRTMFPGNRR